MLRILMFSLAMVAMVASVEGLPSPAQNGSKLEERIFGGWTVQQKYISYLVSLQTSYGSKHFCGGVIVASDWVATAAHCLEGRPYASVQVVAGIQKITETKTKGSIGHVWYWEYFPGYNGNTQVNDLALIRLKQPFVFSSSIRKMPILSYHYANSMAGYTAYVTGWGLTQNYVYPDSFYEVSVPVWSNSNCKTILAKYNLPWSNNFICAGGVAGKDTCVGDSGGPMVSFINGQYYLLGITSTSPISCGSKGIPGIYTSVVAYSPNQWIQNLINGGGRG